ncbi:MAG: xanthine dehydrogenase accessory protein XdhC [Roseobacter sp.]
MSFDRSALISACKAHGRVARVVVAGVRGSVPREVGAAMLVWDGGQSGTIGGGALEYELAQRAREQTQIGHYRVSRHALGPDMGQCCGGAVEILTEVFDLKAALALSEDVIVRGPGPMPLEVSRLLARWRREGAQVAPTCLKGWMVEPVKHATRPVWIWGAGHVGRALVSVLCPLPDFSITWVDTSADRFPATLPDGVEQLVASVPAEAVRFSPPEAAHFILTYSHVIDLDLCDAMLSHGCDDISLIGSATKWVRFRKRLIARGHAPVSVGQIACPIGNPALGKHPQAIALGVASALLVAQSQTQKAEKHA